MMKKVLALAGMVFVSLFPATAGAQQADFGALRSSVAACSGVAGPSTVLEVARDVAALFQRRIGEGAAVVARVLVEAHVQPALRLAQEVVAHGPAAVVEALDAALQRLVGLLIGLDGFIADACRRWVELRALRQELP